VVVIKRSMKPGFAGAENELYHLDKTLMLFGDAKAFVGEITKELGPAGRSCRRRLGGPWMKPSAADWRRSPMCTALPGKVLEIVDPHARTARVDIRGTPRTISLGLLDVRPGDWVLVGMGLALERISEADAAETLRLLDDLEAAALETAGARAPEDRA
jgi:hydrogenase assembly chaperone HypC/HupF